MVRVRIGATGGLQLAYNPNVRLERSSNSQFTTPTIPQNEWLQPFQVAVPCFGMLPADTNKWNGITWNEHTKELVSGTRVAYPALTLLRIAGSNFPTGAFVEGVAAWAIGPWSP